MLFREQSLGGEQTRRFKSFGESAIDFRQYGACLVPARRVVQHRAERVGGAQFEHACALFMCDRQRLPKTSFGLRSIAISMSEVDQPLAAPQLSERQPLAGGFGEPDVLVDRKSTRLNSSHV